MDKEMVFHELMDRMVEDKCPVCEFVEFRLKESLERFLYEGVNTPHLRYKIEKTNGFCNYHAHRLMELGDPLSHAILYHDFLTNVIKDVPNPKNKIKYDQHKECFFCIQQKSNEDDYVKAFLEFFENEKFATKYKKEGNLCVPHLIQMKNIKFSKKKIINEITETTLEKYKKINSHLSEIKRKSDYRYTDEEWTEEEVRSWRKAVLAFNGK